MYHLQLALEGTSKQLFSGLGLLLKMQSVAEEGHVGRKHICDILKLVSGTLVISFRCWKRKLTEITHSQGLLIIFSKLHNLRLNLKLLACTTSPAWSWVAAVRDVTVN